MRLIDADALLETLNKEKIPFSPRVNYYILNAPTVDAEPVRYGRWEYKSLSPNYYVCLCSECGGVAYFPEHDVLCSNLYCQNCGAKMDEVE